MTEAAPNYGQVDAPPCRHEGPLRDVAKTLAKLSRQILEQVAPGAPQPESTPRDAAADCGVTTLTGLSDINEAVRAAIAGSRTEILTAQPGGPRPKKVLDDAFETVRQKLGEGVAMRTIYQHSARFDEATKAYVRAVTDHGVQVRTLAEFFDRMIIVDRSTAFIPASPDRTVASMITEPSVVRFLTDAFERCWDRAEAFPFVPNHAAQAATEVLPAVREAIRQLLTGGHSDKAIARRLAISERALQTHVAHIKEQLGAKNRTHLGYLLGRGAERDA
jgi:DNA-binding NarL/FixJ family response regulator